MKIANLTKWLLITMVCCSATWAEFYASKVAETQYDASPALIIRLTDALPETTVLSDYVTLTPELENNSKWITLDGGYSWTLPFVEPNTTYQVDFTRFPVSINDETFSRVDVSSNSRKQYSNQWEVKTSPIQPSASFSSDGQYMTSHAPQALPVTVVNIDSLELDIFRVKDDKLNAFLTNAFYSGRIHYDSLTSLNRWGELVHTSSYSVDVRAHQRATLNLDVTPATEKFDTGVYVAVLRKPGVYEYRYDTTFFTQSDIGLHARYLNEEVQAVTNSIKTGEPLAGIEITYYWPNDNTRNTRTRTSITNENGTTTKLASNMPSLILAKHENQVSFVTPKRHRLDLSAYQNVPSAHQERQAFLWGPRDLYRPGEKVSISMLLRNFDGRRLDDAPISAEIRDARGSRVSKFTWRANKDGLYQHNLQLDTNAPTGQWRLIVNPEQKNRSEYIFKVEDFLPERLSMTFYDGAMSAYRYVENRNGRVPINGQYLYGAPAAGNKANGIAVATHATDVFEQWQDYRFGNPNERIPHSTQKLADITLDDNGDGQLQLPNKWQSIQSPLNIRVTASVFETGGRPVTRSQSIISLPDGVDHFIGVRPQFDNRPKSNQRVKFDLINVNAKGEQQADTVDIKLIRKSRNYYWFFNDSNGWSRRWRPDAYVAFAKTVELNASQSTQLELPLTWGDYDLEITGSQGNKTVYPFRTQYSWGNQAANALSPEVIDIVLDQDSYQPGETATLRFTATNAGHGLLQVESSDEVNFSQNVRINEGENTLTIEVERYWTRHDLYVSLMVLSAADQVTNVAPKRSLGIAHLPIQRDNAILKTSLSAPVKTAPNAPVTAVVNVENPEVADGARIFARVALVDMGVLNITRFKRPQPEQYFFAPRRFENQYLDMYGKVINNLEFDVVRQRFGGGFANSDDALARGGDKPQSEVQIISFFSEQVEVINGQANVSFDMPAFNGRVKWMVVTWTDDAFGSAEQEMIVADKLVSQLAMPRFLAMGDQSQLSLDLHNLSDAQQTLSVKVSVTGSITSPFKDKTVTLADKEKANIIIPVTAIDYQGVGEIQLTASNGSDINLNRTWRLATRSPYPIQTQQRRQVVQPYQSWELELDLDNLIADTVSAQLTLADQPAINFSAHLDYLLRYPYGCLEQTTSSTLPWVLIDNNTYESLKLSASFKKRFNKPFSDALRRTQIEQGLTRLYKKQKSDGTFGYWGRESSTALWGTAYATDLMVEARAMGIPVDKNRYTNALNALERIVKNQTSADIWTDDHNSYEFSNRAYAAFVLAKANKSNISNLRRLFDQMVQGNSSHSSLPWMHLAAAFTLAGDTNRAAQANQKAVAINRTANRYYADYGSTLRDAALSLNIALTYKLEEGNFASNMETALLNRRWLSTQERISLLQVAKQFADSAEPWRANIITQSLNQALEQSTPFNTVIHGDQVTTLQGIQAQDKRIYGNLLWQGVPKTAPAPSQNGMSINRQYYDLNGEPADLKQPIKSGELFVVRLDIRSIDYRFPEALVVELLPAGFELENQNLLNASVDLDSINIRGQNVGNYFRSYRVEYEEYRDDRYVSAISLVPWNATTLFYLVRAVTPGTYALPNSLVEDMYRPEQNAVGFSLGSVTITQ